MGLGIKMGDCIFSFVWICCHVTTRLMLGNEAPPRESGTGSLFGYLFGVLRIFT